MKGKLISTTVSKDSSLDFILMSGGLGIRHLSIKNAGTSTLVIDDVTKEEILPGEAFYVESRIALVNTEFKLRFKKDEKQSNKAFIRYIVEEVPECKQ